MRKHFPGKRLLLALLACAIVMLIVMLTARVLGNRDSMLMWESFPVEERELPQFLMGQDVSEPAKEDQETHKARSDTHSEVKIQSSSLNPTNIIFMVADDLGYGDVYYNGGTADTPNLDAMAAGPNSIHLTRYYSGAPVCSPTRGSVLTGRNPNRYCLWKANAQGGSMDFTVASKYPLPPTETTIAEILKEHGYHTAVFGKWHIGDLKEVRGGNNKWPVSHPGMHGFDEWWVTPSSAPTFQTNCACFSHAHCPVGHYIYKPTQSCLNYYTMDSSKNKLISWPNPISGDDSFFLFRRLSEYLDSRAHTKQPFFIYLPFHTVHHRYLATKFYQDLYLSRNYSLDQADYYGAISAMDEVVGYIRALLSQYNMTNNTMLWFTSDNGPARNTPGRTAGLRGRKYTLWEGGIRVPGIIEWPAVIQENRKSDFPVVSSDLLPTACDIIGVEPPQDRPLDGMSLLPFIRGEVIERNKSIGWAYQITEGNFNGKYSTALIRAQYKLIVVYHSGRSAKGQLYDLVNDPFEKTDISTLHKGLVKSMKEELEEWRKSLIWSATKEVNCVVISGSNHSLSSTTLLLLVSALFLLAFVTVITNVML